MRLSGYDNADIELAAVTSNNSSKAELRRGVRDMLPDMFLAGVAFAGSSAPAVWRVRQKEHTRHGIDKLLNDPNWAARLS